MYQWKAWHDSRARVTLYILAALGSGVLFGLDVLADANFHAYWKELYSASHRHFFNYDFSMDVPFWMLNWVVRDYGQIAALLAGLSLGACSVGGEYGAGTMHFVLTRPEARRNFVLTDWKVGLPAMVIVVASLAFPLVPYLSLAHAKGPGNVLAGLPALWVLGAAVFGLSYLTTLAAGSAAKGLTLSIAALLTYSFLPTALDEWWHSDLLLRATDWTLRAFRNNAWPLTPFEWGPTVFWLAVAAGFLGASLAWIRYREV
jgi:ABC-type transport system involved in multi-copper enzyme maturation permease subunit